MPRLTKEEKEMQMLKFAKRVFNTNSVDKKKDGKKRKVTIVFTYSDYQGNNLSVGDLAVAQKVMKK